MERRFQGRHFCYLAFPGLEVFIGLNARFQARKLVLCTGTQIFQLTIQSEFGQDNGLTRNTEGPSAKLKRVQRFLRRPRDF